MASWHQNQNGAGLSSLWAPDPSRWKCISDKPGRFASCMSFETEEQARAYAAKTGDIIIPPANARKPG